MPGTIGGLPPATLPLTGTELIELEQDGISVNAAAQDITDVVLSDSYIVVSLSGNLMNERALAVESGVLALADGGANADITLSVIDGGLQNVKLADMSQATIKGRTDGSGTGVPVDLTGTQVVDILPAGSLVNAKLADMSQATVKGRAEGSGTGVPIDLTATQLSAILGTVSHTFTSIILTDSAPPDLIDTTVALNLGAVDPDTSPHLEFGPAQVQAKATDTTTATLNLNSLGGSLQLGNTSQGSITINSLGDVIFRRMAGLQKLQTTNDGITIRGSLGNDPTSGGIQDTAIILTNSGNSNAALLFFDDSADLTLSNVVQDGNIHILAAGDVVLDRAGGTTVAQTITAATGGLQVNNTLTGAGLERVLTLSDLGGLGIKAADTTRSSDIVPSDDPDMSIAITATGTYEVEALLFYTGANASSAGDMSVGLHYTSTLSATGTFLSVTAYEVDTALTAPIDFDSTHDSTQITTTTFQTTIFASTTTTERTLRWTGVLEVTGAGTLSIQWSQNSSDANGTIMLAGSFLRIKRLV